jgi:hypothetical protein
VECKGSLFARKTPLKVEKRWVSPATTRGSISAYPFQQVPLRVFSLEGVKVVSAEESHDGERKFGCFKHEFFFATESLA